MTQGHWLGNCHEENMKQWIAWPFKNILGQRNSTLKKSILQDNLLDAVQTQEAIYKSAFQTENRRMQLGLKNIVSICK